MINLLKKMIKNSKKNKPLKKDFKQKANLNFIFLIFTLPIQ